MIGRIQSALGGGKGASRLVPPSGISAWLIIFVAAAMTFLAVAALAFSLSAQRLASDWSDQIEQTATVRISAPVERMEAETAAVLRVLETTPGIENARLMTRDEQAALLTPWIGADMPLGQFDLPQLIAIEETRAGPDRDGLRLRLAAEAPDSVYDDHRSWRDPIVNAALNIGRLGVAALFLVLATLIALVVLSAQAAVVANGEVISTLRLIGATDKLITSAFVNRLTLRAFWGAIIGAVLGLITLALQSRQDSDGITIGLGLTGIEWAYPFCLPLLVALATYVAARLTVRRMLGQGA